ncbi:MULTISPECIES: hypothetical protein [unclassified Micromonospora]|uniref:hypothetical protein n=1 Tax=unclassified Micromonospora TaxID=2617518 RepID=UPI0022B632D0|nr:MULTISPECIES: hypothetical protein [unclassified Micromonospora]MCZ7475760.1 hypothetical protein [Micromonospora sp. WMMC273]WBC00628.1 hypothetical protein O7546_15745 [Micromonospora sp. WMMA1976]
MRGVLGAFLDDHVFVEGWDTWGGGVPAPIAEVVPAEAVADAVSCRSSDDLVERLLGVNGEGSRSREVIVSDERRFREAAQAVVDLMFTDDMKLFDSMPDEVQENLGPALSVLGDPVVDGSDTGRLIVAATAVEQIAMKCRNALPPALNQRLDAMESARRSLRRP